MISLEKWMILTPLQKLPNNVGKLGKIIVATGFEWLPKVQKLAQSGHTVPMPHYLIVRQIDRFFEANIDRKKVFWKRVET